MTTPKKPGVIEQERRRVKEHVENGTEDPAKQSAKRHAERHKPGGPVESKTETDAREFALNLTTRSRR